MTPYETAPYFGPQPEAADCPRAWWISTGDGKRIRLVTWRAGGRGTVLLFNGRTEYCEKFALAAAEYTSGGYSFATFDWRGQGLSDRASADRSLCHVGDFAEYQCDAAAAQRAIMCLGMPEPVCLLAHSMGGCIALRALQSGLRVRAVHFSAPMWGIAMNSLTRAAARLYLSAAKRLGRSKSHIPGGGGRNYAQSADPEKNLLTSDIGTINELRRQIEEHPELSVGGPSAGWLSAALRECRALAESALPDCPALVSVGGREQIVDLGAIRRICGRWPGASLEIIGDGRHEMMMERPAIRERFFAQSRGFFASAR